MFMAKVEKKEKKLAWTVSMILGSIVIGFAAFLSPGYQVHPDFDNYFVIGILIAIFPPAFLDLVDRRWKETINKNIVYLISNVAEAHRTGMTFVQAIEESAKADYGPLSKELERAVTHMSWGATYEEALRSMAKHIDTPVVYRSVEALIEVGRSGGRRISELLDMLSTHIRDLQDMKGERSRQMVPYVGIIYASFFVFLFVVIILFETVFVHLSEALTAGFGGLAAIDVKAYYVWFYHMTVIEAVISGLVSGKMGEGTVGAGLKHILLLLAIVLIVFNFMIKVA